MAVWNTQEPIALRVKTVVNFWFRLYKMFQMLIERQKFVASDNKSGLSNVKKHCISEFPLRTVSKENISMVVN